ncbi:polysaccharide pyruvyl transferase family protein [Clostridium perfringens]|nr:polysaccharide pyruvyl transferase family protein [Clostridium perfringens]
MKIGILTFHNAYNYGAVLQAYALKTVLENINLSQVNVIDYRPIYIENSYSIFPKKYENKKLKITLGSFKSFLFNLYNFKNIAIKRRKFGEFVNKNLNLSKRVRNKNDFFMNLDFDYYIFGSDQIWNPIISENFDEIYFGNFKTKNKSIKIAYAASFGNSNIDNNYKNELKYLINNLDNISVREIHAKKLLNSITNKEIVHVLDPTLLLNLNEWDKLVLNNIKDKDYLLIYRLGNNEELLRIAEYIAEKMFLKIIEISSTPSLTRENYKHLKNLGPDEFITYFKNSSFIVTDSFHGTSFSVIFNKEFYIVPNHSRSERITSLLNTLNLEQRIIESIDEVNLENKINFYLSNNILNKERHKSLMFLKKSLI